MEISGAAVWFLSAMVLINTLFIAGIAVGLFLVNKRAEEALAKAEPLVRQGAETLGRIEETASQLQERMDRVLDRTTTLVDQVSERIDTTTAIAEEVVTEPLIGAASLMAGINRGIRTYTERTASDTPEGEKQDGSEPRS